MILDYIYDNNTRNFSISYVKPDGLKEIMNFNVDRFKSYYLNPNGRFINWDGKKCEEKWVKKPSTFDLKTYMEEMDDKYKELLRGKVYPKLYTFDIETEIKDETEFPEPSQAKLPITTISIANQNCDVIVLGTKVLDSDGQKYIQNEFVKYITNSKFFNSLGLPTPYIRYIYFASEESMLKYFLENIVSKVPVLAGWNSILFDWQYIQNRIKGYYPNLSLKTSSCINYMYSKTYQNLKEEKIKLLMPSHTLIIDMMDVISSFDTVVLPIKESLGLDYIASESIQMHKIKYNGSLQYLYNNDYPRYVFYNAIDSILVQLIDKKFKTMQNIYTQALYCRERIASCFSKIALTEALIFNDYYERGIKIVPDMPETTERGKLQGAYVRQPTPGKYRFLCCNDFASLYPSSIITCNLSYENFLGNNFTEEELDRYRKDKNYFVSVNGNVYKNDKDYTFKRVELILRDQRNVGKYLAKQLDAQVMLDIEHITKNITPPYREYANNLIEAMKNIGFDVKNSDDLTKMSKSELQDFKYKLQNEITFYQSYELAMKILANSMYGGSSHEKFFWFNMNLANDITGEARNLIHKMEHHIPSFLQEEWSKLTEVHKMLGVKIKPYNKPLAQIVYGDTDSLYISYENLLNTIEGIEKMSLKDKLNFLVNFNTKFMDSHNREYMNDYFNSRHGQSVQNFELETIALSGVWLDVKKRYAQILLWKDGKFFDLDDLPMKIKGLEMIKASVPKQARNGLKRLVRFLLEDDNNDYLIQRLNIKMQEEKQLFYKAELEDICASIGVNNYTKYILDDNSKDSLKVAPKCQPHVRALGNYNRFRNIYKLPGEPIYGGKVKWYCFIPKGRVNNKKKNSDIMDYFAFQSMNYPEWANKYAPISRDGMFQKFMLDPFNRILNAIGMNSLNIDGSISESLF